MSTDKKILKLGEVTNFGAGSSYGVNQGVTFRSSRPDIASVNNSGRVQIISEPTRLERIAITAVDSFGIPLGSQIIYAVPTSVDKTTLIKRASYTLTEKYLKPSETSQFTVNYGSSFSIVYIDPVVGSFIQGGYYLGVFNNNHVIVAPKSTEVTRQWKTTQTATSGTASTTDGLANSNAMNNTTHPAANYCRTLTTGDYTDWYLPAKDEISFLYQNRANMPSGQGFVSGDYWSSTEYSSTNAWNQHFSDGSQDFYNKTYSYYVRAVRKIPASTFIGTATEVPSSVIYSTSTTDLVTISNAGLVTCVSNLDVPKQVVLYGKDSEGFILASAAIVVLPTNAVKEKLNVKPVITVNIDAGA
jgi:hypothetical protein